MPAKKRTLLVLGGSSDQLSLVRAAQRLGLATLCLDMNPSSPAFAEAEESAVVSTRDVPSILAFLEQRKQRGGTLAGVLTMASDIPDVVAAVAEHCGLAGPSRETARLATDKLAMKQRFAERGVPIPWFAEVRELDELEQARRERGTVVLKPIDRSGSRGVFVVRPGDDARELFTRSREFAYSGRVMVEQHLEGPQLSTESVLWDGRAMTPGFADRNYELNARFAPQVMENGGWVPSRFEGAERRAIEEATVAAARALGIERGTAKGDLVWTKDGPKVIEIAARLSGGDLCESLVPLSSGVDYVREAVRIALGEEPDWAALEPKRARPVANRYFFPEPGVLESVEGLDKARSQPWVKKLEVWYRPGDVVPPSLSHAHRFGVFVVVADDRAALERRIEWVYRTVRIVTRAAERSAAA
ncbi:MAG: ATP-grasp domain-containing protein [Planctomycetota bacterium]